MSANDLLVPSEVLIVNLLDMAYDIQAKFGKLIRPPAPGIYMKGMVKPVLKAGLAYYTKRSLELDIPLTNLEGVKEDVLDFDGNIVITRYAMVNQAKFLSNTPSLPVRELEIVRLLVERFLTQMCVYQKEQSFEEELSAHLTNASNLTNVANKMERTCEALINQIMRFMHNDLWHIYFAKLNNADLILEKTCDYRIYSWTQNMESGLWGSLCVDKIQHF